jgi:hypothetical protein
VNELSVGPQQRRLDTPPPTTPLEPRRGSNDPARSRGTESGTSPTSVASVFGVLPLREFGLPRPAGSPFS